MKRVAVFFVVLVAVLSTLLYWRLREQRLESERPSGGSATLEGIEVDVTARISARISKLHVREGDAVKAGQVVAELECDEPRATLAQATAAAEGAKIGAEAAKLGVELAAQAEVAASRQATAAQAVARASKAQGAAVQVQQVAAAREVRRIESLRAVGAASEQARDQLQTQSSGLGRQVAALGASAQAAEAQAQAVEAGQSTAAVQARIAQVKARGAEQELAAAQANLTKAQALVAECTLRAPEDGLIQTRAYEVGEVVLPGTRLLTIVDARVLDATFYLPNAELAVAKPGSKVNVIADALPNRTFAGTIRRVGTSAEFTPRNVQTRQDRDRLVYAVDVQIPNPDGLLRPGMPVEIAIAAQGKP